MNQSSTNHDTRAFLLLYKEVTNSLEDFIQKGLQYNKITESEEKWFKSMIFGFSDEYDNWNKNKNSDIEYYLCSLDNRPKLIQVAGHAFLHIGYDLPRVLANCITDQNIDRHRQRLLFVQPAPMFRQVFMGHLKKGKFGIIARAFGHIEPIEVLAYWIVSLRSVAWIHAEILADRPNQRHMLEINLAHALRSTGNITKQRLWNIPKLDNSTLLFASPLPLTLIAGLTSYPILTTVGVFTSIALIAIFWKRAHNKEISIMISKMAQHFMIEATRALAKSDESYEPKMRHDI